MGTVNVATARNNLAELMNRAAYGGEIIVIESRGKPKAALVAANLVVNEQLNPSKIVITPEVRGGKPRVAGRRITVSDIAIWHNQMQLPPTQIAADYDLSLAEVYAALSYYHAHLDEIEAEIAESRQFAEHLHALSPSRLTHQPEETDD